MFLGFEEVAPKWFTSVVSHVYWVYCAYILLQFNPPGVPEHINSLADKQRWIKAIIDGKEKVRVFQLLTQINGTQRYKKELRQAFEAI